MNIIKVRDVVFGEGMPKICVPIVDVSKNDIIKEAKTFSDIPLDIVEWRADWFDGIFDNTQVLEVLKQLRETLGDIPLLFTFRTATEGGNKEIAPDVYAELNKFVANSGYVDFVDVEIFIGDDIVADIIEYAHSKDVKVIASNHDFEKTYAKDEMVARLRKMEEMKADIPKIAVMPKCEDDVLSLLSATAEYKNTGKCPVITMSMSGQGIISRLAGEIFGSCLTFGSARKASAPGQIGASELKTILTILNSNMKK